MVMPNVGVWKQASMHVCVGGCMCVQKSGTVIQLAFAILSRESYIRYSWRLLCFNNLDYVP